MLRSWPLLLVVALSGCRLPPEREPLKPLPEDGALYSYQEILTRARAQANAAVEAFYEDAWNDLEESAKGLEQTARYLPKTTEQPTHLKESLLQSSGELGKEAMKLADTARAKNVAATTEVLQRITLRIRSLRPKELPEKSKSNN
ncbi:MAG: hypothetical protein HY040_02900 [Planctomycetes bacterium]|nr:hypothetical protein [Planctomycetota bacterium]